MKLPARKYEINLNTALQLGQLVLLVAGGVWFAADQKAGQERNAAAIVRNLEAIVANRDDDRERDKTIRQMQTDASAWQNIEFRVGRLEDNFEGITATVRDLTATVNDNSQETLRALGGIASDVRVIGEKVDRLDKSINGDEPGNRR